MSEGIHVLGGIDEAGLGPLLGPLVVGGLVLAGPHGRSPWDLLARGFCKKPKDRKDRRIRVDDSKKVKTGSRGYAELERSALTLWAAVHGRLPDNARELLESGVSTPDFGGYPWYETLERVALPRWQDRATLELETHMALRCFEASGLRALAYPFRVVDVGTFNSLIRKHDNKGLTLFDATLPVLGRCMLEGDKAAEPSAATYVVDRHGARGHYANLLRRGLRTHDIEILEEAARCSRYRVGGREVVFVENGESRAFPTAAASCLAKYVRELLIEQLNTFWRAKHPELRPTAGYYADGRRFLRDLGEIDEPLPMEKLVRIR